MAVTIGASLASTAQQPSSASSSSTVSPAGNPRIARDVDVGQTGVWTPTGIELLPGEKLTATATGTVQCPGETSAAGPAGFQRGFRDLLRVLPASQAGRGVLLGRIGEAGVASPFVIGTSTETVAPVGGPLSLGVNRAEDDACTARFSVHVNVFPPANDAGLSVARRVDALPEIDQDLFARLPRRVSDEQGNPGDMVNFLILGSTESMQRVFKTAGWVTVDSGTLNALVTGVLDSLSKEAYLTLPMSRLVLFGRAQDFGWAHAEPIKVAASRHHLRVWQAPFEVAGARLWVGAATHDVGFERDQRNNRITHKIDPNVDAEREYVEKTLTGTGLVSEITYVTPANPVGQARTATGGTFQSDGRVLVLKLDESRR
jgi:LssY C-terminus